MAPCNETSIQYLISDRLMKTNRKQNIHHNLYHDSRTNGEICPSSLTSKVVRYQLISGPETIIRSRAGAERDLQEDRMPRKLIL